MNVETSERLFSPIALADREHPGVHTFPDSEVQRIVVATGTHRTKQNDGDGSYKDVKPESDT